MNRLNFSDVAQTLIDQDTIEPPPRDYVLYKMDVSHLYTTYDLGIEPPFDALTLHGGYAFAYIAISRDGVEKYIGTYWPMSKKWVNDHVIDVMPHRATQVHRIDQLDENDVVPTFKKWLEGV